MSTQGVCIDRFEAFLERGDRAAHIGPDSQPVAGARRGTLPAERITWVRAAEACKASGKRLCSSREWKAACQGPAGRAYPYGDSFDPVACNTYDPLRPTRPAGVREAGAFARCRPPETEVFDLSGNVWEWVSDDKPGGLKAVCGGGFGNTAMDVMCRCSESASVDRPLEGVGFRCCSEKQESGAGGKGAVRAHGGQDR